MFSSGAISEVELGLQEIGFHLGHRFAEHDMDVQVALAIDQRLQHILDLDAGEGATRARVVHHSRLGHDRLNVTLNNPVILYILQNCD